MAAKDSGLSGAPSLNKIILEASDISRALKRIAHEILEKNRGPGELVLVGIYTRGVPLAERLGDEIAAIEGTRPPVGHLDISFYRDDFRTRHPSEVSATQFSAGIDGSTVVLVDDVLFTGRTVRSAIDALVDLGRPRAVQLAVLIDRGHRELPIRADYIGKNIPTSIKEDVKVQLTETDDRDEVTIGKQP